MKNGNRVSARLASLGLALFCAASWESAGAATKYAQPGLDYLVPVLSGSAEDPAMRPPLPPGLTFSDGSSLPVALGHFRGVVVLINFWATWCAPCIKEMTFLDRLQGDLKGEPLHVLTISEDQGGIAVAKAFLARQKFTFLHAYADPGGAMADALKVGGLPTSFVLDKQGRLVNRVEGPYEWDNPKIVAKFRELMKE